MAKKPVIIPEYGKVGDRYRTRLTDENGKRVALYADTPEELYEKQKAEEQRIEDAIMERTNPTVAQYCQRWLKIRSATIAKNTLVGYEYKIRKYIIAPMGDMYMSDVTADDIRVAMVGASKLSSGMYCSINMLFKCIFGNAERNDLIEYNPASGVSSRGGIPAKERVALTDAQVEVLLEAISGLRAYEFVMIGLYAGLRREEILGLQWDCVFLDAKTPYIAVRRAWRTYQNKPEVTTVLKTPAARRDIPIPGCLVECLRNAKEKSKSKYVIANSAGAPLTYQQFVLMWRQVKHRSTKEHHYYKYVNGEKIKMTVDPMQPGYQRKFPNMKCIIDFEVTPHQLRHTYITNLLYEGVDPKTVQYLAGHENSKTTMDIYAKVKYNKPEEIRSVINEALMRKK